MKKRAQTSRLRAWLAISAAGILLLSSAGAFANPLDAFGSGPRAISLGGAFTSLANDSSANYYNPAGLAQGSDLRFDIGYTYNNPNLNFNGLDSEVDLVRGLQVGVVLPGEVLGKRFAAGIGMLLLDDRVTRVRSLPQQQPRFVLFDNRVQRLYIAANFSLEPFDHFFVGGGLTFMAHTSGRLEVEGIVSQNDVNNTMLQAGVDVDIESARYAQAGILYAPDAPWSIGLAFRQDYFLRLQLGTIVTGDIVFDADPENPLTLVEEGSFIFDSDNANLYSPMQLVLGFSYDFGPILVSADVGWYRWSQFRSPTSEIDIVLDLDGLDFSLPEFDEVLDPGFSDLVIPRIGLEASLFEGDHFGLTGRTGYFFEDSPAPDQGGFTNYADSAKHGLSAGVGMTFRDFSEVLPKPLELDMSFQYIHFAEREYLKDDPADLVGDYTIDGGILGVSFTLGLLL